MGSNTLFDDHHAISRKANNINGFHIPQQTLTLEQQQKLLFLLNNHSSGNGISFLRSHPPPTYIAPPLMNNYNHISHSSLPPLMHHSHPPLLPLPFSSLPSKPQRKTTTRVINKKEHHKKPTNNYKRKESPPPPPIATTITKDHVMKRCSVKEEKVTVDLFLLAPPPSSLPMPKFTMKPKSKDGFSSCNNAIFLGGGGDDVCACAATDDLRRLLRL